MKRLALVLCLILIASDVYAGSRTSAQPIGSRKQARSKRLSMKAIAEKKIESLQTVAEQLGITVRFEIEKIFDGMKSAEARKMGNKAKELENTLKEKEKELSNDSLLRSEVEILLQEVAGALATRSEYVKAKEGKNEHKEGDLQKIEDVIGILDNALTIARSKVADPENVNKDQMIEIFKTIAGMRSGIAEAITQARIVVEYIKSMNKTPLEVRACE